ncbi:hypothetical protein [Streptacidiphilus sp. EB129]|uniref:hypothetical protein n=1 Tax=Streptacidiphilus sp. EB129 TaxID=3156262 RepID=UPI0035171917
MTAREDLYAAVMSGGYHSPDRSEKASDLIDALRVEVLREAAAHVDELDRSVRALESDHWEPPLRDGCSIGLQGAADLLRTMASTTPKEP